MGPKNEGEYVLPPGDARSVRPGEAVTYHRPLETETPSDEVDVHVAKLNMIAAELEHEMVRGTKLWNRAGHGGAPLASA